jgi:hypothetical protein
MTSDLVQLVRGGELRHAVRMVFYLDPDKAREAAGIAG